MLSKNKEYIVDIVDIGQGGVGIGKYEGFTVFVDGGLVKDKIKVKITKSKKFFAISCFSILLLVIPIYCTKSV